MNNNKVIIITGSKGKGKTTKLLNIIDLLKGEGVAVAGFVALGEWRNGERSKYTLVDVTTDKSTIICTDTPTNGYDKHGRFYFNPQAIEFGKNILSVEQKNKSVIIIDEIGPFELDEKVWHNSLIHHLEKTQNILLLSVREKLLHDIIEKYKMNNVSYYKTEVDDGDIVKEIMDNVF